MSKKIKALVKRTDEPIGHMTWISNSLENLQKIVDGHIEVVTIRPGLVLIVNEDGKLRDLPANFRLGGDLIVGDVIVCGVDDEEFADIPIDMKTWKKALKREA